MDETIEKIKWYEQSLPDRELSSSASSGSDFHDPSNDNRNKSNDFNVDEEIDRIKSQINFEDSSASTDIRRITGILFGGISSRFWLFRKHMMSIDYQTLKNDSKEKPKDRRTCLPFYAWQCITLEFQDRNIDLVIKNEEKMTLFLRFLIMSMSTLDGKRDSATKLIKLLYDTEIKKVARQMKLDDPKLAKRRNEKIVSDEKKQAIMREKRQQVYRQTLYKYKLIRIRTKIGFHAMQKRVSVNELIIQRILKSYILLSKSNSIDQVADYSDQCYAQFQSILDGDISTIIMKMIEHNRDPVVRSRKQLMHQLR